MVTWTPEEFSRSTVCEIVNFFYIIARKLDKTDLPSRSAHDSGWISYLQLKINGLDHKSLNIFQLEGVLTTYLHFISIISRT